MLKNRKHHIFILVYTLLFSFFSLNLLSVKVSAQSCPGQADPNEYFVGWQRDPNGSKQVNYYIDDDFDSDISGQLGTAFTKWNDVQSQMTCLKVNFVPSTEGNSQFKVYKKSSGPVGLTDWDANPTSLVLNWAKFDLNLNASQFDDDYTGYDTVFIKAGLHEIGHTMGLDHLTQTSPVTVMNQLTGLNVNDSFGYIPTDVQQCDIDAVNDNPQCATPPPNCTSQSAPAECPAGYGMDSDGWCCPLSCQVGSGNPTNCPAQGNYDAMQCNMEYPGGWDECDCICRYPGSPVIIDTLGDGFDLTKADNGVTFDISATNQPVQLSWTRKNSDDAWLALDRNGNGQIDNGAELFGNFTPQPTPPQGAEKNGFLALAEYDKSSNGGNSDGKINRQDSIFQQLKLWKDTNKNGVSELDEINSLESLDVKAIDLDYKLSRRTDRHGNQFKYRAKVRDNRSANVGRWAFDVFLTIKNYEENSP